MIYQSPFYLLLDLGIDDLDLINLKRIRQQVLLRFDLNSSLTISILEKEYDKASIVKLFDELKINGALHEKVFHNKPLLDLLEKGDLTFFKAPKSWIDFAQDDFSIWAMPMMIKRLKGDILRLIETQSVISDRKLKLIRNSNFAFPIGARDSIYSGAYSHYDQLLKHIESEIKFPFVDINRRSQLIPEVIEMFNPELLNKLSILPRDIFLPLLIKYGNSGRKVIGKAFYMGRQYQEFDRNSLRAIHQAGKAYLFVNPNDANIRDIVDGAMDYLRSTGSEDDGTSAAIGIGFIAICVFILFVMITNIGNQQRDTNRLKPNTEFVQLGLPTGPFVTSKSLESDHSLIAIWSFHLSKIKKQSKTTISLWDEEGRCVCELARPIRYRTPNIIKIEKIDLLSFGDISLKNCSMGLQYYKSSIDEVENELFADVLGAKLLSSTKTPFSFDQMIIGVDTLKRN